MRAGALRKHYPALTPEERFRLALAALARGDDDDLALLRKTCPKWTYEATDEEFQGQWERSARVMHCFQHLWLVALIRLKEAEGDRMREQTALACFRTGYIHGANAAWEDADHKEPYLETADFERYREQKRAQDEHAGKWERAYLRRWSEVKTVWAGFARFCAAVGFAPETLLGWWRASGEYIEPVRWVLDSDLPIDEAAADEFCRGHLWLWNQREMVVGKVEI
jgi:hypothetical protein